MSAPSRLRRLIRLLLILAAVFTAGLSALVLALRHPRPGATPGPAADALAHALERSVDRAAWDKTGAVRWTFLGKNHHLWDRQRQLDRVRWDDVEVLVETGRTVGHAYRGGREVFGEEAKRLIAKAHHDWINDSYWLAPLLKLFDDGVTRAVAPVDGGAQGLLISYASGGDTPGDAYLWIPGSDGRAAAWRMWVSVLPVPGIEFRLSDWVRLSTGALVATRHKTAVGLTIKLDDVAGAATLAEIEPGPDPFARMFQ